MAKEKIQRGSGNVFADMNVAHPQRVLARAQIMSRVAGIIKERRLTQKETSEILGIPQSKVSCLMNGKLSMFSLDHLFELLNTLPTVLAIVKFPVTVISMLGIVLVEAPSIVKLL